MTSDERWQALKDYLNAQIERRIGYGDKLAPSPAKNNAILISACKATLAKMRELEAQR